MMRKLGKEDVADWFDNKPLFICEYYETDDVMAVIQEIDMKIDALGIEVLYLPNLEYSLIHCPAELQLYILSSLKDLAFDKQILRNNRGAEKFIDEITDTFEKAKKNAPAIVFLDDMDKFANEDDFHCDANEYVAVQAGMQKKKELKISSFLVEAKQGL